MITLEESEILDYLTQHNYGPDGNLEINWQWSRLVRIKPKERVVYRFSFNAWFENVIIVYSIEHLDRLAERGNYSRTTDDFEFINHEMNSIEHIITGWHKPSPPRAKSGWLHSPKHEFQGAPKVDFVGFSDDQNSDPTNPSLFRNGQVSIVYF
jgi:hypothetical protein